MPKVESYVTQNYRRTQVGTSRFGTRTLQMYEIWIYYLSDAVIQSIFNNPDNVRDIITEGNEFMGMGGLTTPDQPIAKELATGSIVEAIVRGVQAMGEIYVVGQPDWYNNDVDNNDLVITVAVSADTVNSGWEQVVGAMNGTFHYNNNATWLEGTVGDSVDQWANDNEEYWDGLDIYPVFLVGDSTSDSYGPFALSKTDPAVVALRDAKKAQRASAKQSMPNMRNFTPKMKRNP